MLDQDFTTLDLERDGPWLTVWFNTPERRNPLSDARVAELLTLCEALQNSDIRGVTFRGRGGMFCAGGDLSLFRSVLSGDLAGDALEQISRDGARLFDAIAGLPQVTVCVAEGAAMAGGLGMLCLCDVVIATPACRFGLSEVRLGLIAAQIAPFVAARIGMAQTRRLMVLGQGFDGVQAKALGLCDHLTDNGGIDTVLAEIRADTLKSAPSAVAATKRLLAELPMLDRDAQIDAAARSFAAAVTSDEGREGLTAFASKRRPTWAEET